MKISKSFARRRIQALMQERFEKDGVVWLADCAKCLDGDHDNCLTQAGEPMQCRCADAGHERGPPAGGRR